MAIKIAAVFLVFFLFSCGEKEEVQCSSVLDRVPYFATHRVGESSDSLQRDLDILRDCGKLDSIDAEIFNGQVLGSIMVALTSQDKKITYRSIIESFHEYKSTDNYAKLRDAIVLSRVLENRVVTESGFEKDKELLIKVGMPLSELDAFRAFVPDYGRQGMTYKQAFQAFNTHKLNSQTTESVKIEFRKLADLESAMKAGEEVGKPMLLYFSCYACVNARKIEDQVLTDSEVKRLMDDQFLCFIAYTDDRTEGSVAGTVGKKFIKLQSEKFRSDHQPYFCIVDKTGKVLSEIGYTNKPGEFIEFLKKGMK